MPVSFIRQRAAAVTYQGPGDIVSGATAWYGLRAYNAAYATGSNNAINVRRASDNSTSNIVILANGKLDIATANTFAGVDATASATATASTTLNLTSASSTPHVGSTITGTGVTQPCYIVSVGSFAGGTGTVVVNAAQTLAAVSISMQYALFVTEAYDQSGNNYHLTQSTAANQPQLLPSFSNGMPVILSTVGSLQILSNTSFVATAQPFSMSAVGEMSGSAAGGAGLVSASAAALTQMGWFTSSTLFGIKVSNSGFQAGSGSLAGVLVSAQGVFNGASSVYSVNNVETTGTVGAGSTSTEIDMAISSASVKYTCEGGLWPVAFNLTQRGNLYSNEHTYWGTP